MASQNYLYRERIELVKKIQQIQVAEDVEATKLNATYVKTKVRLTKVLE